MFKKVLFMFLILGLSFSLFAKRGNYRKPAVITPLIYHANQIILNSSNHVVLNDQFSSKSVNKVIIDFYKKIKQNPTVTTMYLVLMSPGGSIQAGLDLIDTLNALNIKIHTITIFAASMGFITAQHMGIRYITEHGTLMTHKASGGFQGEFPGQLDSRYSYYLRRITKMEQHTVNRSRGIHTLKSYRALMENEFWCDGQDCIDQGFADKIAKVKCDNDIMKMNVENISFNFFGQEVRVTLKTNECPMTPNGEVVNVLINNQEYKWDNKAMNKVINNRIKSDARSRYVGNN